jgi:hypothetical protein
MQTILNVLWEEANTPPTRWKRTTVIVGGALLAASIAGLGGWSLFAPRPAAPPSLAQPAPSLPAAAAPVSAPPTASAPAIETPPAHAVRPATPAVVKSAPPATPPAKAERREQLRPPQGPTSAPRERSASSTNNAEGDDPGAVIDWLLKRPPARGQ